MQFPPFQVPGLGNGMTIALNAVIHVFFSHGFAIGVFGMIAISEYIGYRRNSPQWTAFSHDLLKFAAILITGIGAVTGVGIWFTIGTLEPRGTADMLRVFFWPWFLEWVAFTAEVIVLVVYYYTWEGWAAHHRRGHVILAFAYMAIGAFAALAVTGILGFMLTPNGWPWQGNFWGAFFNPTFLPQLIMRIAMGYVLGTLITIAFLIFTKRNVPFHGEALAFFGKVILSAGAVAVVSAVWYFYNVPPAFRVFSIFAVITSNLTQLSGLFWVVNGIALAVIVLAALLALRKVKLGVQIVILPAVLLMMGFFTEFERIREFIRGPYIMPGYMYANQVLLKEAPYYSQAGVLPNSYWFNASDHQGSLDQGLYLFGQNCSVCHTIGGINDIQGRVRGRSLDGIRVIVAHTHDMVPFMTPFSGTQQEKDLLASFLYQLGEGRIQFTHTGRFLNVMMQEVKP